MNAIVETPYTRAWQQLGASLSRPDAVLAISAHWLVDGTAITAMPQPRTIHDFGGFPRKLHEAEYPAPGDPELAAAIADFLSPLPVSLDASWGLDHGVWSILMHAFPAADIPVLELSIDARKPPSFHLELGARLAPLRERGILLLGSGNIVHNLERFEVRATQPFDWAVRFDGYIRDALERRDDSALVNYASHPDARLAAPDIEHFLPLLYIEGARREDDALRFIVEGFDAGSISMRSVRFGA